MKSIILFRHANTESEAFSKDHDRPLVSSGISDAKKMGIYLAEKGDVPDLVISSTALRAKTTAEVAMAEGKWRSPLEFNTGIYGGDPLFLLDILKNQDNSYCSICLVGHEPIFSTFIARSTGDSCKHLPKGSAAKIYFNVDIWKNIVLGLGRLGWMKSPQELG